MGEALYVSWGGTGRGAAVRAAIDRAAEAGQGLRYLGILDDEQFGDLTPGMAEVVSHELRWLLEAQLRMVSEQVDESVPVEISIRQGDVEDEAAAEAVRLGADLILLGAPLPENAAGSRRSGIDDLVDALRSVTGATVEIVD